MIMAIQGIFKPQNPKKYKGDSDNIVYRSSWELKCMMKFDLDPRVKWWASEELIISYPNPVKKRMARYFPDFVVCTVDKDKKERFIVIEVKPAKERIEPVKPTTKDKRKLKRFLNEHATYAVNKAKWKAAEEYCKVQGWTFVIWDEYTLGMARSSTGSK
jgi:hypothetical protein